jgi:AmmeMemoRadiSam system protein B
MVDGAGRELFQARGAGRWFPGDPDALRALVRTALADAGCAELAGAVVAGIAPHAGYIYSGGVAGHTYAALEHSVAASEDSPTVVVLGFSHRGGFPGVALLDADAIATPLGACPLDRALGERLVAACGDVFMDSRPHAGEHSAENQVPFLQEALPGGALVLGLMGDHRGETIEALAQALYREHAEKPLVVIASTDLLHDADYDRVCRTDTSTLDLIASLDVHKLASVWDYSHQVCCGISPVLTVMRFASLCGVRCGHCLAYRNSGDVFPESRSDWVVGYGSVVFCER